MLKTWADMGIDIPEGRTGEVQTTCPKCSHERKKRSAKCLSANITEGVWVCHHCAWAGSLSGREERYPLAWRKPQWRTPAPISATELTPKARDWFAAREITDDVLVRNQISVVRVYMPQVEDETTAVVFPYFRGGKLVNRKYRDAHKNFRMDTGAERILYKLDDVTETVVIVEGEIDALSVEVAGITSCVSVPDGAPAVGARDYSSKFAFLDTAEATLASVTKIIIAVDNDAPGKLLEDELSRRLGRERCWRVTWPDGCKDANEVLVKHGATDLRWFIDNAQPYPIEGVFTTLGESDKIRTLYRDGLERGVPTGWRRLNEYYTVRPGEFTVVIGVPGSGKSNFVDALLVNLAYHQGWSFALFSPENQPIEDHMARMIEKYTRLPFDDGPTPRMSTSDLEQSMQWAAQHFWWMLPSDEKTWDIDWILARAKELVYRHGIRGLVIDPWNELESQRAQNETDTEYISRVLRTVRQFGRQHGVHIWMVVHPTKLYRGADGKYPIPTLYDAAGSAHFRNKCDNGLCVWRDFTDDVASCEVDIHIQKIRFRQIGRLGKVTLHYDKVTATYDDEATLPGTGGRRHDASAGD